MRLPENFLDALQGLPGFDRESFEQVHADPLQVTSIRINPKKSAVVDGRIVAKNPVTQQQTLEPIVDTSEKVPWSEYGYYLNERPSFTFDPLFHAGCYYVQEASSMFLEQAIRQLLPADKSLKVLDISAAPGGKTTHILSLLPEGSVLVSNEVIRNRMNVLMDNVVKWGSANALITNNDPSAFRELRDYFDVIVVDAPCSGSGLFRRDEAAIKEWSLNNVHLCSQRQQRILADVLPSLKEDGLLVYSTCSYSREEDEDIAGWLHSEWNFKNELLMLEDGWQIVESTSNGNKSYRFYPDKLKGEGFFICCFRKTEVEEELNFKPVRQEKISKAETETLRSWIMDDGYIVSRFRNSLTAIPEYMQQDFNFINSRLNLHYGGVRLGEIVREKLIPDHALAMADLLREAVPFTGLNYEQAIQYLQKQEMQLSPETQGWQLVRYRQMNLGWINALKNRINNYYPKDLRILKQHNTSGSDKI